MTQEDALREALKYVADCLEKDEVYLVHKDEFARGEAIKPVLAQFCRRIAKDGTNWHRWCEMKEKSDAQKLAQDGVCEGCTFK